MEKITPSIGCFLIGIDCFMKASFVSPQQIFTDHAVWIWAIIGLGWFASIITLWTNGK